MDGAASKWSGKKCPPVLTVPRTLYYPTTIYFTTHPRHRALPTRTRHTLKPHLKTHRSIRHRLRLRTKSNYYPLRQITAATHPRAWARGRSRRIGTLGRRRGVRDACGALGACAAVSGRRRRAESETELNLLDPRALRAPTATPRPPRCKLVSYRLNLRDARATQATCPALSSTLPAGPARALTPSCARK